MRSTLRLVLAFVIGGYMLLNGIYARLDDTYIGGSLGPWSVLVHALGIDPRSYTMNDIFIFYGICWFGAIGFYLARRRIALLAMSIATLWYVPLGGILSIVILGSYLRPARTDRRVGEQRDG